MAAAARAPPKCNRYCTECEYEEFLLQSVSYFTVAVPHRARGPSGGMEAIMPRSTTRLAMGAVIALGGAIVGLSATGSPLNVPQPDKASLSETDAQFRDRQQIRRYFLQDRRDWRERLPTL